MCPDCKQMLESPIYIGRHLAHPRDSTRIGVFDVNGQAICPDMDCLTLWERDHRGLRMVVTPNP